MPGPQLLSDSVPEVGEDAVTSIGSSPPQPAMSDEERQELQEELVKVRSKVTGNERGQGQDDARVTTIACN